MKVQVFEIGSDTMNKLKIKVVFEGFRDHNSK